MRKKILLSSILVLNLLCSCSPFSDSGSWKSYVFSDKITTGIGANVNPFDTVMQFDYFLYDHQSENYAKKMEELYKSEIIRLHQLYDTHYKYYYNKEDKIVYNNAYILNQQYGSGKEIYLDQDLYNLLKDSIEYCEISNGYFNIFAGQLSDYWNNIFNSLFPGGVLEELDPLYSLEQKEELERLVAAMPTIEETKSLFTFNDKKRTVIFNELEDVVYNGETLDRSKDGKYRPELTLGGVAKGYATNLITNLFDKKGYDTAMFFSGGSSMSSVSKPIYDEETTPGQLIQVSDPRTANSLIGKRVAFSFYVDKKFAVSTSGNYTYGKSYSFMDDEERIYRHHIIDLYTGYPANYYRSVTIISNYFDAGILDALSTAFVSMPLNEALEFRKNLLAKYGNKADLEAIFISQEGDNQTGTLKIDATSTFNDTFDVLEGVEVKFHE